MIWLLHSVDFVSVCSSSSHQLSCTRPLNTPLTQPAHDDLTYLGFPRSAFTSTQDAPSHRPCMILLRNSSTELAEKHAAESVPSERVLSRDSPNLLPPQSSAFTKTWPTLVYNPRIEPSCGKRESRHYSLLFSGLSAKHRTWSQWRHFRPAHHSDVTRHRRRSSSQHVVNGRLAYAPCSAPLLSCPWLYIFL